MLCTHFYEPVFLLSHPSLSDIDTLRILAQKNQP